MIIGKPELKRYLEDKQWIIVSKAIRAAGGKVTDGNRLHIDAILDLMHTRMPWRDLDYRYGTWSAVHYKFVRWFETGTLHGIVMALFKAGLTENWQNAYPEISHGPSAVKGPPIRSLMAQIATELRRHHVAKKKQGRAVPLKLPKPEGNTYREKSRQYAQKVKAAVKARKGLTRGMITNHDWEIIATNLPEMAASTQNGSRRQIEELIDVMRTNKGWAYMDPKIGKWTIAYARFAKWASDGTMSRLVKCMADLGLTKDWNRFLVAPLGKDEKSLKLIIGSEAYLHEGGKSRKRVPRAVKSETQKPAVQTKETGKAKKAKTEAVSKKSAKTAVSKTKNAAKGSKSSKVGKKRGSIKVRASKVKTRQKTAVAVVKGKQPKSSVAKASAG